MKFWNMYANNISCIKTFPVWLDTFQLFNKKWRTTIIVLFFYLALIICCSFTLHWSCVVLLPCIDHLLFFYLVLIICCSFTLYWSFVLLPCIDNLLFFYLVLIICCSFTLHWSFVVLLPCIDYFVSCTFTTNHFFLYWKDFKFAATFYVCDCIGLRKYMWSTVLYPIKYLKIRFPNLSILATLYTDETWIVEHIL
jgi:hypothetical protein